MLTPCRPDCRRDVYQSHRLLDRTTRWTPPANRIAVVAAAGAHGAVVLSSSAQPIVGRGDATGGCSGTGGAAGLPAEEFHHIAVRLRPAGERGNTQGRATVAGRQRRLVMSAGSDELRTGPGSGLAVPHQQHGTPP